MAEISAAQALFPNLPSEASVSARAPAAPDRLGAASVYGSPEGGAARAREVMNGGVAEPAAAAASEPGTPPTQDWLAEVADRADHDDRGGETHVTAAFEPKDVGLDESDISYDFVSLASEAKLSKGAAKEMVDLHLQASTNYWDGVSAQWQQASTAQFGQRLEGMVAAISPVLNGPLTTPGFRALLEQYRLGNNPDVIQTLHRYALAMARRR